MKNLFIEKVELNSNGQFICSKPIRATPKQIKEFKSKPCNHDLRVDKLIYDIPGWLFDLRHCGVCDAFLGEI